MKQIVVKPLSHNEERCYGMYFPYDLQLIEHVKKIPHSRFSRTNRCWYIPQHQIQLNELCDHLKEKATIDIQGFDEDNEKGARQITNRKSNPVHEQALRMLEQKLKLRGYSVNTLKTYYHQFKEFLFFYFESHPIDLEEQDIRNYLLYLIEKKKVSRSHQNQAINAIKFFYEKVLQQPRKVYYLERPLKERKLPEVLSEEEVMRIFEALDNLKHRCMLMLTYSAGLRRSEVLNLQIGDVDLDRCIVFIRSGKGRKDRQSILAKALVPLIEKYLENYQPKFWLFEGQKGDKYTASSLQKILKKACLGANIKKDVRLHMLRHSFATHLLESGTSTRYIQVLLGHESPVTTELYAQVTRFGLDKIKSPLDIIVTNKMLGEKEK